MAAKKKAEVTEAGNTEAPTTSSAPAEPKFRGPRNMGPADTLSFGADKDGKVYGPDYNPKRPGTKAATMWTLYTAGMTVKAALDAGVSSEDLAWNVDKGFIKVTKVGGEAEAQPAAATAETGAELAPAA